MRYLVTTVGIALSICLWACSPPPESKPVTHWDTSLPSVLSELHKLEFDFADGEGIDFEPFATFMSAEETASWIEAWTGNPEANGNQLRVFGQDGTGGYAAFWLVDANKNTLEQPIVFFGSEGDRGVVAANFNDYLWLLAGGIGPMEAVYFPGLKREPNSTFLEFAEKHATGSRLTPQEIVAKANGAYPGFEAWVESICR